MIAVYAQDLAHAQMLTPAAALQGIMAQIVSSTTATVQTSLQPMYAAVMEHVHLQTIVNVQHIIQILHVTSPLAPEFQVHQVLYAQVMVLVLLTILALVQTPTPEQLANSTHVTGLQLLTRLYAVVMVPVFHLMIVTA